MTKLDWREETQRSSATSRGGSNIWFGVSMALVGVITGVLLAVFIR